MTGIEGGREGYRAIKMTTNATKVLTHKQMVNKMLKNPDVKVEVEKLNRGEFAILDEALAAKRAAALFANNR